MFLCSWSGLRFWGDALPKDVFNRLSVRIVTITIAVLTSLSINAHEDRAYLNDSSIDLKLPDWMSHLHNWVYLSDLSLIGTHNSMTYNNSKFKNIANGQSLDLKTQLEAGIRFLDIRVRHIEGVFALHHGILFNQAMFGDVLDQAVSFLKQHPSETLVMRLRRECDDSTLGCSDVNNSDDQGQPIHFVQTLNRYLDPIEQYIYQGHFHNPSLGMLRGKILILNDFSANSKYAPLFHMAQKVQDDFKFSTNWNLYSKWEKVKAHMESASEGYLHGDMYINYLSGSGGSFPYFVASGHSSSGTSAPRLSTGLITPLFDDYYPDFPRTSCLGHLCTISFEGINTLTSNFIEKESQQNQLKNVGIVVADFPGPGLIESVIGLNFKDVGEGALKFKSNPFANIITQTPINDQFSPGSNLSH